MLIDGAELRDGDLVEAAVCVVGAGVAGLTVARELSRAGTDVCVLESGGRVPGKETRELDRGESVGHPYYPLHRARSRAFGGSSHRWLLPLPDGRKGARLRPLDPIDFERRDALPHSGWPFGRDALDPFYRRATELLDAGTPAYEWDEIEPEGRSLHEGTEALRTTVYRFAARDVFTSALLDEMEGAPSARVLTRATLLEVETSPEGTEVPSLRVAVPGGEIRVRASVVVLAMGGIEVPRTLLLSRGASPRGLGNGHDLVGRYFMEHPHTWAGFWALPRPSFVDELPDYGIRRGRGGPRLAQLALREDVLRREGLLNFSVHLVPGPRPAPIRGHLRRMAGALAGTGRSLGAFDLPGAVGAARHLPGLAGGLAVSMVRKPALYLHWFRHRDLPVQGFRMNTMAEQAPNPDSRVTLGDETDRFGHRRARLDWRLSALDVDSLRRCRDILDRELRHAGLGRLERPTPDVLPAEIHGGWHHMGTTRMHDDPSRGVVDADCRVHGVANLYVAGPSVFPTGGCANPVLTIVALSIRLAERILDRLG